MGSGQTNYPVCVNRASPVVINKVTPIILLIMHNLANSLVEFYLYPTVSTALIHSVKPELTE